MNNIRILNPAHPGGSITSRKRAERYVRRGVAKWESPNTLRFIEDDYRHQTVVTSLEDSYLLEQRAKAAFERSSACGYDAIGRMTLDQVQGLPVCGPAIKCFTLLSKRGPGYRVTY